MIPFTSAKGKFKATVDTKSNDYFRDNSRITKTKSYIYTTKGSDSAVEVLQRVLRVYRILGSILAAP